MEHNIDKIKRLEGELARYKDKVGRDAKRIAELEADQMKADIGVQSLSNLTDSIMAVTAIKFGTYFDKEKAWRMELPSFDQAEILKAHDVKCQKNENGYTIGVFSKEWHHESKA